MVVKSTAEISAQNQAAEATQQAAVEQQRAMNAQRVSEMEELNREAALELTEHKREALREQAAARVAAAESGVAGATPLRNLANVYMQEGIKAGTTISKNEAKLAQVGIASQTDFIRTKNTIQEAEAKKTTGLNAALQIGMAAGEGYAMGGGFEKGASVSGQWGRTTDLFIPN